MNSEHIPESLKPFYEEEEMTYYKKTKIKTLFFADKQKIQLLLNELKQHYPITPQHYIDAIVDRKVLYCNYRGCLKSVDVKKDFVYSCGHIFHEDCIYKVHNTSCGSLRLELNDIVSHQHVCPFDCEKKKELHKWNMYTESKYGIVIPNKYKNKLKFLFEDGDLVDTDGYRGIGMYFYEHGKFIKTKGEYGYFLPEAAWKYVERDGLEKYKGSGVEYVGIPKECKIIGVKDGNEEEIDEPRYVYLDGEDYGDEEYDYLIINGKIYNTGLSEPY